MTVGQLYAALRRGLVSWFGRQLGDWPLAEDLAMLVWERCLRAERRGQALNAGYVWTAARTILIDHHRRRRASMPLGEVCERGWEPTGPSGLTFEAQTGEDLLALLPGHLADCVVARAEGYQHWEIARQLGVSTDTSKKLAGRARRLLSQAEAA